MRRWSIVAGFPLALFLVAAAGLAAASASAGPPIVYGYYPVDYPGDTTAFNSLSTADEVDAVGAFLFQFDEQGNVTGQSDARLLELARSRGVKVEAVIHNYRGGFDRGIAAAILTDPAAQQRALDQIEALLTRDGYHGVQIDIENVDPQQRAQLSQFVQRLSQRLKPRGLAVSMAVPAKTWDDPSNGWSGAFDYPALAQAADYLAVMTYDEHWITSEAGPIASEPWVKSVVEYASRAIPKEKLLLGIAGYGYDWPQGGGMATMLKASDAARLAQSKGATILWDSAAQVPYFRYTENGQTRVVYFENAESARRKLELVKRYQLGGVALWRLGFEDPDLWAAVAEMLKGEPPGTEPPGTEPPGGEPPAGGYVVQPGDTMWLIAQRHGISLQALVAANPGIDPWWIMPGQRLALPGGAQPPGQPPAGTYAVRPGDTLWLIARRHGIDLQALVAANPGVNAWWLMPGQILVLPPASGSGGSPSRPPSGTGRTHVVQPGDTLWLIAQRYGFPLESLMAANPGVNAWWLMPGQSISLP